MSSALIVLYLPVLAVFVDTRRQVMVSSALIGLYLPVLAVFVDTRRQVMVSSALIGLYLPVLAVFVVSLLRICWQAHMQARYVILRVLIDAGLVSITERTGEDGKPDLLMTLDREKITTEGKKAVADFLLKVQVGE